MREPIRQYRGEGCHRECNQAGTYSGMNDTRSRSRRGSGDGMSAQENNETREAPVGGGQGSRTGVLQPDAREGRSGPAGVAERSVVPMKPDNAGGGKRPQLKEWRKKRQGRRGYCPKGYHLTCVKRCGHRQARRRRSQAPCAARGQILLREPDAGNPPVRFDERDVETERLAPPRHVSTLPPIPSGIFTDPENEHNLD